MYIKQTSIERQIRETGRLDGQKCRHLDQMVGQMD